MEKLQKDTIQMKTCSVCQTQDVIQNNRTMNNGEIYVAECLDTCEEFYDGIDMYKCKNGHTFYISKESE